MKSIPACFEKVTSRFWFPLFATPVSLQPIKRPENQRWGSFLISVGIDPFSRMSDRSNESAAALTAALAAALAAAAAWSHVYASARFPPNVKQNKAVLSEIVTFPPLRCVCESLWPFSVFISPSRYHQEKPSDSSVRSSRHQCHEREGQLVGVEPCCQSFQK